MKEFGASLGSVASTLIERLGTHLPSLIGVIRQAELMAAVA